MRVATLYTTREVAHLLFVSEDTVREMNASGYLGFPCGFKVRGQWRFFADMIDDWIKTLPVLAKDNPEAIVIVHKVQRDNQRDKETRIFEAAKDMYDMLRKVASKNKVCSHKEITELLARIDND